MKTLWRLQPVIYLMFTLSLQNISVKLTWADDETPVKVQLVSATTGVGGLDSVMLGVEFFIDKGWKIYAPDDQTDNLVLRHPTFQWQQNHNIKDIVIQWPRSLSIVDQNVTQRVYKDHVIIPLIVDIHRPDQPFILSGIVDVIACSVQCLPLKIPVSLSLPRNVGTPTDYASKLITAEINQQVTQEESNNESLWFMMLVALIGGCVLNFMPCVLPILSLKIKSLAQQQCKSPSPQSLYDYKINFMASIAGIMISFMGFATVAALLQASGKIFGWGTHFQEPLFITSMSIVMVIFAANLWGWYDIHLPYFLQDRLARLMGHTTQKMPASVDGFVSGVFATLLATPCTAPFLGTALGYALTAGTLEIYTIFMFLGLGFSLPYIIGLIVPLKWMTVLKPGQWMMRVNQILGFGLLMTTVWLLWILYQFKGLYPSMGVLLLLIVSLISFKVTQPGQGIRKAIMACIVAALIITYVAPNVNNDVNRLNSDTSHWQIFNENKIIQAVQAGKIVFVDVTASWCTTCQLNKALVLNTTFMQDILSSPNVVAMRADWTSHDAEIGQYLARFKRYGIPCNIVYGPKALQGIVLPELLDKSSIVQALEDAGYEYNDP